MKTIKLNETRLKRAIHRLNDKIALVQNELELKALNLKLGKLKALHKLNLVLLNNKTSVKINLNQLILVKRKAKLKGVKFTIMNNINFYLNLCEDIQLYKSVVTQKYNILVKI